MDLFGRNEIRKLRAQLLLLQLELSSQQAINMKLQLQLVRASLNNAPKQPSQFTPQEVRKLIQLCHPDKHHNSTLAQEMTSKLLQLKERTT